MLFFIKYVVREMFATITNPFFALPSAFRQRRNASARHGFWTVEPRSAQTFRNISRSLSVSSATVNTPPASVSEALIQYPRFFQKWFADSSR